VGADQAGDEPGRAHRAGRGQSKWITSEAARADVQLWRARSGALLTGSGTVAADDPLLSARVPDPVEFVPPLRVVLDSGGRLDGAARVLGSEAGTLAVHAVDVVPRYADGVDAMAVPRRGGGLDLRAVLAQLAQREVNEVQVEAGATLCGALLEAHLVDELLLYVAPVLLGDRGRPLFGGLMVADMADRIGFRLLEAERIGPDLRLRLRPDDVEGD
jgi:diaminohydroxyphosphoribosylaminopyrimidine deaminase/5-amino-6-(5-phosphoribosylamino)uracil reductase